MKNHPSFKLFDKTPEQNNCFPNIDAYLTNGIRTNEKYNDSMTHHVLDNPAWNAMISANSNLALGNDHIKIFQEDVGPFAGLEHNDEESFRQLYEMVNNKRNIVIISVGELGIPEYWKIKEITKALQMIFINTIKSLNIHHNIVPLEPQHVPQMIALTKLTHPGPFLQRTIEFGNYEGIFDSGKLIAMTGQRMHANEYVEVSAVCTHPDHTGKGYGKSLINNQLHRIVREGNIPFLHVRADNEHAISLYKHLGFTVRRELNIYVIQKGGLETVEN